MTDSIFDILGMDEDYIVPEVTISTPEVNQLQAVEQTVWRKKAKRTRKHSKETKKALREKRANRVKRVEVKEKEPSEEEIWSVTVWAIKKKEPTRRSVRTVKRKLMF